MSDQEVADAIHEDEALMRISPEPPARLSIESLIGMALQHAAPVEGLERLLAMRERLQAEAARTAFFEALSDFQAACPVVEKRKTARVRTSTGGEFTYRYAPLEDIVRTVAPLLRQYGLSYSFDTQFVADPPAQVVACTVHHVAGHQESSTFRTPVDGNARMNVMQQSASALTYAKRYAFCNALGILTGDEDNDGDLGTRPQGSPGERSRLGSYSPATTPGASAALSSTGSGSSGPSTDQAPRPLARNPKVITRPANRLEQLVQEAQVETIQRDSPPGTESASEPASPELAEKLDAMRTQAIEKQVLLTRTIPRYAELPQTEVLKRSRELLNASIGMHFGGLSLLNLQEDGLTRVHRMLDEALERKGL